jgi:hypothetical protein
VVHRSNREDKFVVSIQGQRNRPAGVTIIAILAALGGITELVAAVFAIVEIEPILGVLPTEFSYVYRGHVAAAGVASMVIAYGMLKGLRWAWPWAVVGLLISVAWAGAEAIIKPDIVPTVVSIIVAGVMVYYLHMPNVKAFFGRVEPSASPGLNA